MNIVQNLSQASWKSNKAKYICFLCHLGLGKGPASLHASPAGNRQDDHSGSDLDWDLDLDFWISAESCDSSTSMDDEFAQPL